MTSFSEKRLDINQLRDCIGNAPVTMQNGGFEKSTIEINGVMIAIEEKPIKNIHLSVYPPDGRVHISVPLDTSDERVRLYVLQKWVWLSEKRKNATNHPRQLPRDYVSGEEHFSRGQSYRLKVEMADDDKPGVYINGDYLVLSVRSDATPQKRAEVLNAWYRKDLKLLIAPLLEKWENVLSVRVREWDVLRMSMRWGSCNRARSRILFNLELAKKPLHCVEYIVAHEMAHLIEQTHNDHFQQILFTYLPTWKDIRKELNEFPLSGGSCNE